MVRKIALAVLLLATLPGLWFVRLTTAPRHFYRPDLFMALNERKVAVETGMTNLAFRVIDQREGQALQHITAPLMESGAPYPLSEMVVEEGVLLVPSEKGDFVPRDELEKLFEGLTSETVRLLAISLAILLVALLVLFRRAALRHLLVIAATLLATLGTLGYFGEPLTFFHLLAFFVLIGLGLDYSIMKPSRIVLASYLTSLVGLGALAFTSFPVTHALGVTFAAGLTYAYVFSLLVNRN